MDDKKVADYFVIAGLSPDHHVPFNEFVTQDGGCSPKISQPQSAPITDITVIIRSQGEVVPPGYTCIETTPSGFPADLNHGSLRSPNVYLCFKRGRDKPPLVDIGVLYEGKERVMSDSEVVHTTVQGRPANVNNSGSRTFFTYRRARENAPCNQLVVTDICVILANKGESPPHAFCLINKNLNKGIVGSDVFICYKKSMNRPPLLCFKPSILSRFPLEDYPHFSLPESVPLFCFPMGATVEVWPQRAQQPRPVFSTFVLTSDSAEKVYGAAVTFYERFSEDDLSDEEKLQLLYCEEDKTNKSLHTIKSICILSRWPFFDTFERFLMFLHRTVIATSATPSKIAIERYISHFMLDVPFPSPQRPKILVQLGLNTDDTVLISQPPEYIPLPLNGASFSQMLRNLGPENCLNVLLFALTEQKILLHSLRPDVLTSVAEAVITIIFPFHWQCPYIPLCPLGLCDVLNAPLPFIVGVDSRFFDYFEPPIDVACIDLDTNSIYISESRKHFNPKLLPKKPTRILKATLDHLFDKLMRPQSNVNGTYGSQVKTKSAANINSENLKKLERQVDLEIQEAFIKFMALILHNFRSYLLPITRAPTVGATDPSSLFDLQGFLKSRDKNHHKFYTLLFQTQMFTRFIEERSFVTDKDTSLAFFDECSEKLESLVDAVDAFNSIRLLEIDDIHQNDRTVFIPPPEPASDEEFTYPQFGPLNPLNFHRHPRINRYQASLLPFNDDVKVDNLNIHSSSPISKRTKQEIRTAQKIARKHAESPITWPKCLVGYCYSLWFIHLPAFVNFTMPLKGKPLKVAFEVLLRMQSLNIHPHDEVCYRVLMLLCGIYSQPILAVKVLYEMKRNNVIPNAITYGYYNKAVLESKWPSDDSTATLMWNKLRNVILGVAQFRKNGQLRAARTQTYSQPNGDELIHLEDITIGNLVNQTDKSVDSAVNSDTVQTNSLSEVTNSITRVKHDVDFRESNSFRVRTQSIVRNSASNLNRLQDFDSSAGVLMTSNLANYSSQPIFDSLDDFLRKRHKSADGKFVQRPNSEYDNKKLNFINQKTKAFSFRSYSFGNDSQIIQKLKDGVLKDLRNNIENNLNDSNEKIDQKKDLQNDSTKKPTVYFNEVRQRLSSLTRCDEDPEEDLSEVEDKNNKLANDDMKINNLNNKNISQNVIKASNLIREPSVSSARSSCTSETKSTDSLDEKRNNIINGNESAFSPIKDAIMNMELFSPDGKVASTLRSSFRFASRLAKSKSIISRSSTFYSQNSQNTPEKSFNRLGYLFKRESLKSDESDSGTPMKMLSRSATLPPISPSKNIGNENNDNEKNSHSQDDLSSCLIENDDFQSEEDQNYAFRDETLSNFGSPWTNKLSANKHSEYVYSTIKSAANTMANRFSGFKSSLASSSSASNSPSKVTNVINMSNATSGVASMASGTASLISQWASLVAEKFPSNFVFDDDECSSVNSLDIRRSSFAASEDEISERSREGSTGRNLNGVPSTSSTLFELLEKHYSTNIEPTKNDCKIVFEVVMTSCSRCYNCLAVIYDEEVMEGWSADDSNLNTRCTYCGVKFVPMLTIKIKDLRDDLTSQELLNTKMDTQKNDVQTNLESSSIKKNTKLLFPTDPNEPFTVPYLSPLVLRKEIENVLDHEGDLCLSNSDFVDNHPIIFWNLIWFFKRINLPTHLYGLCLTASTFNKNKQISENSFDYRNVLVRCLWDNERFYEELGKPMHQLWIESNSHSSLLHALVTDEKKITRPLMEKIIDSIQCNDLTTPIKLLITERRKNTKSTNSSKQHSIYRDLLYLAFVALGRDNIDHTAFDREYRRAYDSLTLKEQAELSPVDKPPCTGAIFCRRFFKELELQPRKAQLEQSVVSSSNSLDKQ